MKYIGDVTISEWHEECKKHKTKTKLTSLENKRINPDTCNSCKFDSLCFSLYTNEETIDEMDLTRPNPGDTHATTNKEN